MRAKALQSMRDNFEFLETRMSDERRQWILESGGPSLADINAIWVFNWLLEMVTGGLPGKVFSAKNCPKTFASRGRYREALDDTKRELGIRPVIQGPEVTRRILDSDFHEQNLVVDESDFVGVKKRADQLTTTDSCRKNHEVGVLVCPTRQKAVVEKTT